MHSVYLSLGSNIGDRKAHLSKAIDLLAERIGGLQKKSRIYETQAWGVEKQTIFFNNVILLTTTLRPSALLVEINKIEKELGRVRKSKWTSRCIDIDILFYDDITLDSTDLIIPHPHLQDRNFVLVPFLEISPNFQHPTLNRSIRELYFSCTDTLAVYLNEISL